MPSLTTHARGYGSRRSPGRRVQMYLRAGGLRSLQLKRPLAIFAVGEACFLEIEIALDPPPDLVCDLAVAQQHMDEFPLRRNQFARQGRPGRRHIMLVGVE